MIYAELSGGLGNQMFVYAFARAMGLCCQEPVTLIDRQDWKTGSPAHTALALQALHISSEVQFITDAGFAKQHLPVQNAAKASAPGAPVLVLCAQAGDAVTLTVADRGCGIPPELIPRVTEPFFMVDKSRARRQGGSGLGLALCQRIAAAHGSALRIESEPGRGTRVSVTLPVWKEDAP